MIQGALTTIALFSLGVPYAILLGAVVSVTAIIPYAGAFIGGGLVGIIVSVPLLAVLRVLFYFFRVRLDIENGGSGA